MKETYIKISPPQVCALNLNFKIPIANKEAYKRQDRSFQDFWTEERKVDEGDEAEVN